MGESEISSESIDTNRCSLEWLELEGANLNEMQKTDIRMKRKIVPERMYQIKLEA